MGRAGPREGFSSDAMAEIGEVFDVAESGGSNGGVGMDQVVSFAVVELLGIVKEGVEADREKAIVVDDGADALGIGTDE